MSDTTERIRAMLDERGVEWRAADYSPENVTEFKVGGIQFRYIESSEYDDFCWIDTNTSLTPEQAIEATLGRGECRDIEDSGTDFCCSACGARLYIDTGDTYTMIAADEHTIIKRPNYCPNCGRAVRA